MRVSLRFPSISYRGCSQEAKNVSDGNLKTFLFIIILQGVNFSNFAMKPKNFPFSSAYPTDNSSE